MTLDSNGLIVQTDGDGGDSAQRTGMYYTALMIRNKFGISNNGLSLTTQDFAPSVGKLLTLGGLIRNPSPPYNDPPDTSRDQTNPMIIACGFYEMVGAVKQMKPNYMTFYPNGDVASPQDWNTYQRALGGSGTAIGDLFALGGAVSRCVQAKKNQDDVGDDLNTLLCLTAAYVNEPTSLTKAALSYYLKNRPPSFGTTQLSFPDPVVGALQWYFRPAALGNPECASVWEPIIAKLRVDLGIPL